jgi:hypothetical protein
MSAQRMVEAATAWLSSLEPGSGPRGLRVLGARGARPLALHPTEQGSLPRAEMGPCNSTTPTGCSPVGSAGPATPWRRRPHPPASPFSLVVGLHPWPGVSVTARAAVGSCGGWTGMLPRQPAPIWRHPRAGGGDAAHDRRLAMRSGRNAPAPAASRLQVRPRRHLSAMPLGLGRWRTGSVRRPEVITLGCQAPARPSHRWCPACRIGSRSGC